MADTNVKPTPSPLKRRCWRILGLVVGIGLVLIVVAYFVVFSSAFIKGIVLPRVSDATHADITVRSVSIHPFSEIQLQDLKIQTKGQEPLMLAPEVRVRYNLFDILHGHFHVDEAILVSPSVLVIENPDGTSNLDPFLQTPAKQPSPGLTTAPASRSSRPLQVELRKLALSNATFTRIKRYGGGNQDLVQVTNANVTLDQFGNGQSGRLAVTAGICVSNHPSSPDLRGLMEATVKGSFNFSLLPDLKPAAVKGETRLDIMGAGGQFRDLSAFSVALDSEVTPSEIRKLALHFTKNGAALGELSIRGPLDMAKLEGQLAVELRGIDRRVLNLAGAASGMDFGTTAINSTNQIEFARSGSLVSARGHFEAVRVQLTCARQTTPTLNFGADYDITLDRHSQTATFRRLDLSGTQNGSPLLNAQLSRPMDLAWGTGARPMTDSSLELMVSSLNLADWKPFLGNSMPAGNVDLNLKLWSQGTGQQLNFKLDSQSKNLAFQPGGQRMVHAAVSLEASGQASDLKHVNLAQYQLQIVQRNQPVATAFGSGTFDLNGATTDIQLTVQASLAGLFQALEQPGLNASAGTLDLRSHFTQKPGTRTIAGNLDLKQWTGQFGNRRFNAFGTTMDFNVGLSPEKIKINQFTGNLSQADKPGGSFGLSGSYTPASRALQLTATLVNVNQNGLGPFLDPLLAEKELISVGVNGDASLRYVPQHDSVLKANLQVTNLVVTGPQLPAATPLEAGVQFDATIRKQTAEVNQLQLTLTPTSRAQNRIQLQGRVDFSRTNAIEGNVKLAADSLDLSRYYDLFAGSKPNTAQANTSPTATPDTSTSSQPTGEPPAKQLPFHNFVAALDIRRAYLHEIEIGNWQTSLKLDGGHCLLQPCQLTLNGSPVTATLDADLGVPGWKYRASLAANHIPVQPIADSLAPNSKGQYNGILTADGQLQGAGITGASLKKNLSGGFSLNLTNANIQVIASRTKFFFIPININLIATLLNVPEITRSPITGANVKVNVGKGQIDLQQATVTSPAFLANVHGVIPIASVFTNSPLNLPVEVFLTNSLARKLTFPGVQTPAANYVPLPVFLTVTGTIGQPESRKNTVALLALTAGAVTGLGESTIGNVIKGGGNVVDKVGGILNGILGGSTTTSANTQTNQPAAHRSGIGGFLDRIIPK